MRLLGLYILTLILFGFIHYAIDSLEDYITGESVEEDDDDDVEVRPGEMWDVLIYYLLTVAAIIMFAVLPAIGKGGLLAGLVSALILSVAVDVVMLISNLSFAKRVGAKGVISASLQTIVATQIITAGSYYMALFLLA